MRQNKHKFLKAKRLNEKLLIKHRFRRSALKPKIYFFPRFFTFNVCVYENLNHETMCCTYLDILYYRKTQRTCINKTQLRTGKCCIPWELFELSINLLLNDKRLLFLYPFYTISTTILQWNVKHMYENIYIFTCIIISVIDLVMEIKLNFHISSHQKKMRKRVKRG